MDYRKHLESCEEILDSEDFSCLNSALRSEVNRKVNRWMDWFFGFRGTIHGKSYDYSDYSQDHRKERHHGAGILLAGQYVVGMYGEKYRDLAEKIAEQHIMDDFGRIPHPREL